MTKKLGRPKKNPSAIVNNTPAIIKLKVSYDIANLIELLCNPGYGGKTSYLLKLIYDDAIERGYSPDAFGLTTDKLRHYGKKEDQPISQT